jgi:ABC-type lipoprotein release transport system permease subunit
MVILFSTIGILLAISFIYVYTVSRGKAEDLARQSLSEESFQITLKDKIGKSLAELKNEGEIADWLEKMAEFEERIDFLEKVITKESYEKEPLGKADTLEGGKPDGGNKTV